MVDEDGLTSGTGGVNILLKKDFSKTIMSSNKRDLHEET
jgi:hypothetical protein